MNKTPDEIKKGLDNPICVHFHISDIEPRLTPLAFRDLEFLHTDALAYIQQLEAANAELLTKVEQLEEKCHLLERERDAAVKDLRNARNCCHFCKNDDGLFKCKTTPKSDHSCFEWRGVKEE